MAARGAVIVTAIVVISAIFIAAFAVNAYVASNLQFRGAGGRDFDLARLSSGLMVDACNPTSFPVSFDQYRIDVYYRGDELATMSLSGKTIMPNSSERLTGIVDINGTTTTGLFAQAMADARHKADVAATALEMEVSGMHSVRLADVQFPIFARGAEVL